MRNALRTYRGFQAVLCGLVIAGALAGAGCGQMGGAASPEEEALVDLERRIEAAHKQFLQASRSAGLTGMDTTADVASAQIDVQAVDREFQALKRKAPADLKDRMTRFEARLEEVKRELDLN